MITTIDARKALAAEILAAADDDGGNNQPGDNTPDNNKDTETMTTATKTPKTPFDGLQGDGGTRVENKRPSAQYSASKSVGKHAKTGLPVCDEFGREVRTASDAECAKAGAFLKHLANRSGLVNHSLDDHEKELLAEVAEHDTWCGAQGGQWVRGLRGSKALLDDATSGGSEIVPEFFDSNIITFPLLTGELFPFIDLQPVPRGSSVEGASVGNPTVTWGTAEGTEVGLFDSADLVAEIDTTIHSAMIALEIGMDFTADAAVNIGRIILGVIGQRLSAELDQQIAIGDGVNEPEGIFQASGLGSVNSANGTSGPLTVGDYESMMFGIGKQYRNAAMRPAFIANDVSYQRARSIAVGTTDARRVFGMTHNDYQLLGWPYKVQNDVANNQIAYGAMSRYRLYRRQGFEVRWVDGGKELARKNLMLLIVRGRFGGKVVDGNAFTVMSDAQA